MHFVTVGLKNMQKLPINPWVIAAFMGTSILGMGAWDFERAISRLDGIESNTAVIDKSTALNTADLATLKPRVDDLETKYVDVDHRLIKLEPR